MKKANNAPVYAAALYPELAELARSHGYALAVHGSLARDFDLICIPWADKVSSCDVVIDAMCERFAIRRVGEPGQKNHGRVAYTISVAGECFIDLSFVSNVTSTGIRAGEDYTDYETPYLRRLLETLKADVNMFGPAGDDVDRIEGMEAELRRREAEGRCDSIEKSDYFLKG